MSRPLTAAMAQALKDRRPLCALAEIEHPSGTGRYWTGIYTLNYNGYTWTGAGVYGSVSPITKTSDISIQEIRFQLSGIDTTLVAKLDDAVRNLTGKVWLACLDELDRVIADPYMLVDSVLDYQTLSAQDDGKTTIAIVARTGFFTLERGIDEAWTPENQREYYSGDTGMDLIPALQNQDIQWTAT